MRPPIRRCGCRRWRKDLNEMDCRLRAAVDRQITRVGLNDTRKSLSLRWGRRLKQVINLGSSSVSAQTAPAHPSPPVVRNDEPLLTFNLSHYDP